jgi:hypothetical protein
MAQERGREAHLRLNNNEHPTISLLERLLRLLQRACYKL